MKVRGDYALVVVAQKDFSQAVEQYRRILEAQPESVEAMSNLAWLLATSTDPAVRDVPAAMSLVQRAADRAGGREAGVLDTLAVVYAEAGQFDRAVETASKAVELALDAGQRDYAEQLRNRLALFRQAKPLSQVPRP